MTAAAKERFRRRPLKGATEQRHSEFDDWMAEMEARNEEAKRQALAEGRLGRRARLRRVLLETYGKVKIPREVRKAAKGLMDDLQLAMWWTAPDPWLRLAGGHGEIVATHKGLPVTPQREWKMGRNEDVVRLLSAIKGDPAEKEVGRVLSEQYGSIKVPKEVRRAAEGLMEGLPLSIWWAIPNDWMWPKDSEGLDITTDFLDADGNTTVTPLMLWTMGQKEDVIDLLMAMKGDPYEQVIEAATKG